jgi:hypothetical protein
MLGGCQSSETSICNPLVLAKQMQKFANMFFGDLYRARCCPSLHILVIGHMANLEKVEGGWQMPQFCFVRAEQKDNLNRTVAVGVPISRAILRQTQPCTNILDLDTGVGK